MPLSPQIVNSNTGTHVRINWEMQVIPRHILLSSNILMDLLCKQDVLSSAQQNQTSASGAESSLTACAPGRRAADNNDSSPHLQMWAWTSLKLKSLKIPVMTRFKCGSVALPSAKRPKVRRRMVLVSAKTTLPPHLLVLGRDWERAMADQLLKKGQPAKVLKLILDHELSTTFTVQIYN